MKLETLIAWVFSWLYHLAAAGAAVAAALWLFRRITQ